VISFIDAQGASGPEALPLAPTLKSIEPGLGESPPVTASGQTFVAQETCSGDLNSDGLVDAADLVELLQHWGQCDQCPQDLNGDANIDAADMSIMSALWGNCP
jgi:hypothetical protein